MQGSAVAPNWNDRPRYTAPAPALLGFDETILGYCSHLVGLDFDGGDLNTELAERCVRANKNVLRLLEYAKSPHTHRTPSTGTTHAHALLCTLRVPPSAATMNALLANLVP